MFLATLISVLYLQAVPNSPVIQGTGAQQVQTLRVENSSSPIDNLRVEQPEPLPRVDLSILLEQAMNPPTAFEELSN